MTAIQRRRLTRARYRQMKPRKPMFIVDGKDLVDAESLWNKANMIPYLRYEKVPEVTLIQRAWWQGRIA